jgi:hypothetical protein
LHQIRCVRRYCTTQLFIFFTACVCYRILLLLKITYCTHVLSFSTSPQQQFLPYMCISSLQLSTSLTFTRKSSMFHRSSPRSLMDEVLLSHSLYRLDWTGRGSDARHTYMLYIFSHMHSYKLGLHWMQQAGLKYSS